MNLPAITTPTSTIRLELIARLARSRFSVLRGPFPPQKRGPTTLAQFSYNNLPLWRPNFALSLGGRMSPSIENQNQAIVPQHVNKQEEEQIMKNQVILKDENRCARSAGTIEPTLAVLGKSSR